MDDATERRIIYAICALGLIFGLWDLSLGLEQSNLQVIGVAVLIIVITIATPIAVWRSGRGPDETGDEDDE